MNKYNNEKDVIKCLFNNLDNWRHHPKYQLERRVDIFFSLYLKEVLEDKFKGDNGFCMANRLIPEFPVRKGTILEEFKEHQHRNMSYNIDYLTASEDSKNIIFVELKTEQKSINEKQNYYLKKAMETDFNLILKGIMELCKATKAKDKYYCLLKELQFLGLISNLNGLDYLMKNVNDSKGFPQQEYKDLIDDIKITSTVNKKYLYVIQPTKNSGSKNKDEVVITFNDFIKVVDRYSDEISDRFRKSLEDWCNSNAGDKLNKK